MIENEEFWYEASVIAVVFDEKYDFVDLLHIGISHNPKETAGLIMDDIWRLVEDFEPHEVKIKESRSMYDEPITIVHCGEDHYHYYILFDDNKEEK